MAVTKDYLQKLFRYDPELGRLIWVVTKSNRTKAGTIAGTLSRVNGYRYVGIDGSHYLEHRLIWLFAHGAWPAHQIDHINCEKTDNSLANLREATPGQNLANSPVQKNNFSGFKGVSRSRKHWRARINFQGKFVYLGVFSTPEAAHAAYVDASQKLYGDFARAA